MLSESWHGAGSLRPEDHVRSGHAEDLADRGTLTGYESTSVGDRSTFKLVRAARAPAPALPLSMEAVATNRSTIRCVDWSWDHTCQRECGTPQTRDEVFREVASRGLPPTVASGRSCRVFARQPQAKAAVALRRYVRVMDRAGMEPSATTFFVVDRAVHHPPHVALPVVDECARERAS